MAARLYDYGNGRYQTAQPSAQTRALDQFDAYLADDWSAAHCCRSRKTAVADTGFDAHDMIRSSGKIAVLGHGSFADESITC